VADGQPASGAVVGPGLWADAFSGSGPVLAVLLLVAAGLLALCSLRPGGWLRALVWVLGRSVYRLRVRGREHVPATT
jgi:hypothetical protein